MAMIAHDLKKPTVKLEQKSVISSQTKPLFGESQSQSQIQLPISPPVHDGEGAKGHDAPLPDALSSRGAGGCRSVRQLPAHAVMPFSNKT